MCLASMHLLLQADKQIFVASRCEEKGGRFHNYSIVKNCQAHVHIGLQLECNLGSIKKKMICSYAITSRAFHQPCVGDGTRGHVHHKYSERKNKNGVNTEI